MRARGNREGKGKEMEGKRRGREGGEGPSPKKILA